MKNQLSFGACCALVALLAAPPTALAASQAGSQAGEPVLAEARPESWGTSQDSVAVIHASQIMPSTSAVTFVNSITGVFETSSTGDWWGEVYVPSGALVKGIEMEACDTDAAGAILFGMARQVSPGGAGANVTTVGTTGATPGCSFFFVPVTTPFTMDNFNTSLYIFVNYGSTSSTNRVILFRVNYRLQVSPAPATATFPNDVPTTHPLFRFVEAMAAAGITGGCGAGAYCPDSPLTRGQMAVFFSTALGLHFAP